jgi:hypothetical protein
VFSHLRFEVALKKYCDLQTDRAQPLQSARDKFGKACQGRFRQWHKLCGQDLMKMALLFTLMLATGGFALGCKKSADNATAASQTNMIYNYTYDKREVFIDDASADLKDLDQGISDLSDKVTMAGKSVMAAAQPRIEDLHKQQAALSKELDALKNAKEADWNQLKADYQKEESQIKVSLQESLKLVQTNIAGS